MACCLARQQRVIEAFFMSRRNYIKLMSVVWALARATLEILYEMCRCEEILKWDPTLLDKTVLELLVDIFVDFLMIGLRLLRRNNWKCFSPKIEMYYVICWEAAVMGLLVNLCFIIFLQAGAQIFCGPAYPKNKFNWFIDTLFHKILIIMQTYTVLFCLPQLSKTIVSDFPGPSLSASSKTPFFFKVLESNET